MTHPFLSLSILARDPEGAATLERCLRSVLERPGGSMFDEIVVVWGGEPATKCREVFGRLRDEFVPVSWAHHVLPTDFPRSEGGIGDFAAARNFAFSLCRGTWVGYLDADDVVPSALTVGRFAESKKCVHPPVGGPSAVGEGATASAISSPITDPSAEPRGETLREMLKRAPAQVNCFSVDYHYGHDAAGNLVDGTVREWLFRWRAGFTWVTPAGMRCHERVEAVPPNRPSLLNRNLIHIPPSVLFLDHYPCQSFEEKMARNDRLVDATLATGTDSWMTRYYAARSAELKGRFADAARHDQASFAFLSNDEERFTTSHCLARVFRHLGRFEDSLSFALMAYHVAPERGEGIADVIQCSLGQNDFARAVLWYEKLLATPQMGTHRGVAYKAYEVELWPHLAAAHAYHELSRFPEAVAAAGKALAFAPYDVNAQRAVAKMTAALEFSEAKRAAKVLFAYAVRKDHPARARALLEALPYPLERDGDILSLAARAGAVPVGHPPTNATVEAEIDNRADGDGALLILDDEALSSSVHCDEITSIVVAYGAAGDPVRHEVFTPRRVFARVRERAATIHRLEHVPPVDGDPSEGAVVCRYAPGIRTTEKRVVFYCPRFIEKWGPFSPERQGIGGSEEMVVQVARRLATEGADVTVYGAINDLVVDRDVLWLPYEEFDPTAPCDVLVSHRTAHLGIRTDLGAKKHYVWEHDRPHGHFYESHTPATLKVDKYLFVSEWQAAEYVKMFGLRPDQWALVRNAPDPEDVPGDGPRDPHRVVYCSAPFRGLSVLLDLWPRVLERVPDAKLDVCYGWQVHDAMGRTHPQFRALKAEILEKLEKVGASVTWHDRLPAPKLRALLQAAGVFAYPSTYEETSCRALIRAMACGCWPVYRALGALVETAGGFGHCVDADPGTPEFAERFADRLAYAMETGTLQWGRRVMSEHARKAHDPYPTWLALAGLAPEAPAEKPTPPPSERGRIPEVVETAATEARGSA